LKSCYATILKSLVAKQQQLQENRIEQKKSSPSKPSNGNKDTIHLHKAEKILKRLLELGKSDEALLPTAEDFNDVIRMWGSSTFVDDASVKCQSYLESLWSLYQEQREEKYVPWNESYYHAIVACSARDRGSVAAKRAESLMAEMESRCGDYPQLTPTRDIANGVMNAWSKSGQRFKKGKKCEKILEGMIEKTQNGKYGDISPDTNSFNIVLNALAQGKEKNSEFRAEALLQRMEALTSSSTTEESGGVVMNCPPDEISFNTVLNCWAMSRQPGAAERATTILDHMKKRHEAGLSNVHPDWSTYTTVLKAWARCRAPDAIERAEAVFQEYRETCESDRLGFSHNAFTYNSMINCYAKSKHPEAGSRALELFETMKANAGKPGWELCFVDIYTYTSLIDAISRQHSYEASETAIALLEEVEKSFLETGDVRFQPNIRVYTSVVNAIGRCHKDPDRAKDIVDRVEYSYLGGESGREGKPDVVFYNALINAYGWSAMEGRSQKSFEILKHMISLHESGKLTDAKPDTVSFNSVLNACAHEQTKDPSRKGSIMKTVVEAFELLNASPDFGKPDQSTYVQVLLSIATHMAKNDEKRALMAEATFRQCAGDGLVGPVVVPKLHAAIPHERFQELMGSASTGDKQRLRFDVSELPQEWTANALSPGRRSRSRRRQTNFQVTKNVISHSTRKREPIERKH